MPAASALTAPRLSRDSHRCGWPPVAYAAFSTALIFGALRRLLRRFGAVRFGIFAVGVQAQRGLVHPRCHAIGCRPDLPITDDGPVECRVLGPVAVVDPCSEDR